MNDSPAKRVIVCAMVDEPDWIITYTDENDRFVVSGVRVVKDGPPQDPQEIADMYARFHTEPRKKLNIRNFRTFVPLPDDMELLLDGSVVRKAEPVQS